MADLTKLKGRRTLGTPPTLDEASPNLLAPEVAPISSQREGYQSSADSNSTRGQRRLDGRTLRRTGRTVQFATRVSLEWDDRLRRIALRDRLKLVEILERALDAYEDARR